MIIKVCQSFLKEVSRMLVADDVTRPLAVMSVKHKPSMKSIEKSKRDETKRHDTKETKCFYC